MFYSVYAQNNNKAYSEPKKNILELSCFPLFSRVMILCVIVPYLWICQ